MIEIICHRINRHLVPVSDQSIEQLKTLPSGTDLKVKITRGRNVKFHRKYMALMNWAFDEFEPAEQPEFVAKYGATPEKNFDAFRKDVAILAGFGYAVVRLNGDVRMEAKSIAFGNMEEDSFVELYEATLKVLYKRIFEAKGYTDEDMRNLATQLDEFG